MPYDESISARERLNRILSSAPGAASPVAPPRFETEFSDEVVARWREEGRLGDLTPEQFFHLDAFEYLPLEWRLERPDRPLVRAEADLDAFRQSFVSLRNNPVPECWKPAEWKSRAYPLAAAPWDEGFFQLLGIRNGATLNEALSLVCEQPALAEAQMDFYAHHVVETLDEVMPGVDADFAVYYEPIASTHGPVIAPEMYRHFVQPALRRVVDCLRRHGVEHHIIWSTGNVKPLIPLWLEAGINGFHLMRGPECGITYVGLRNEFGSSICLFGGIDWRAVVEGPEALRKEFDTTVRPLLDQGGYVPFLNDRVRPYVTFDSFQAYRAMLDELIR